MRKKDIKGELNLFKYPSHLKWVLANKKNQFPYHGVYSFCGVQGSGKTLTAVRFISNILNDFPDCYLITNIELNFNILKHINKNNVIPLKRYYQIFLNYDKPTIFLIDEAHLLFNSLNSRNTDVRMFQVISQNRKRKRVFILTSQVFNRLELVMREQINTVIQCDTYFNYFTRCIVVSDFKKVNDDLIGKKEFTAWYSHNRHVHYDMYDTYQTINFDADSEFWYKDLIDKKEGIYEEICKVI